MRIVIVDLYKNSFLLKPFEYMVNNRISIPKHKFFVHEALKEGYEVLNLITNSKKAFQYLKKSIYLSKIESKYVFKRNGMKDVKSICDMNEIQDDDLVIFYPHLNDDFEFSSLPGRKYVNVNHFFSLKSVGGGGGLNF